MSEPCYHLIRVTFQQNRKENLQALPCAVKWGESADLNQLRAGPAAVPAGMQGMVQDMAVGPGQSPLCNQCKLLPDHFRKAKNSGAVQ